MKLVTVCILAMEPVKPSLMSMGTIPSSLPRSPLQPMKISLTERLLEEVEDDATRFAILNHFLDGFVEPSSVKRSLLNLSMPF